MLRFFRRTDPFFVAPGDARIAVGAPHHGTRPNVDADLGSGPIAEALAAALSGRVVVVSDLRRQVDVNKNPLRFQSEAREQALRYQNEMFSEIPALLVEIHGHVSGQYAIEISSGFDLDPDAPGDARFLERLHSLKQALPQALAGRIGQRPSVGVYPLDRDVKKTATDTFTFQKIRRARNLVGLEWYGLHIELNAELRSSRQAQAGAYRQALAEALAQAISSAFEPLPAPGADISTRLDPEDNRDAPPGAPGPSGAVFRVTPAPESSLAKMVADGFQVLVHPIDMEALGALDGDLINLSNDGETLNARIISSQTVRAGQAALPARLRNQLGLSKASQVAIRRAGEAPRPAAPQSNRKLAVSERRPEKAPQIWLSPEQIARFGLQEGGKIQVQGQPAAPPASSVTLHADPAVPDRLAALSTGLMERLALTTGEVITLT